MSVRLGAVGYLNARPLVYGLECGNRFSVRFDVPSECARLLHEDAIDVGLIPSIEYLRGGPYAIAPDLAIASDGPVASVALFTTRPMKDVRSIAMDTSSRTSVALARVLCARLFRIQPTIESRGPDLADMLACCDAALIIGDTALFLEPGDVPGLKTRPTDEDPQPALKTRPTDEDPQPALKSRPTSGNRVEKIDLGEAWRDMTGLPFVYAFWAGRPDALNAADVAALQRARDEGVKRPEELAAQYLGGSSARRHRGADYLRNNIKYYLGESERAGLELFYAYAAEAGVVPRMDRLRFFEQP